MMDDVVEQFPEILNEKPVNDLLQVATNDRTNEAPDKETWIR